MQQLLVSKQSKYRDLFWTTRVMTVDPSTGVVYLSRKEFTGSEACDTRQHKVFVTQVVMWPHFKKKHIGDGYDTTEAALTLRLKGFELPYTAKDTRRRLADASYVPLDRNTSDSQDSQTALKTLLGGGDLSSVKKVSWMLRCTSLFALRELVDALTTLQKRRKNEGSSKVDSDTSMDSIKSYSKIVTQNVVRPGSSSDGDGAFNNTTNSSGNVSPEFVGGMRGPVSLLARKENVEQKGLSREVQF